MSAMVDGRPTSFQVGPNHQKKCGMNEVEKVMAKQEYKKERKKSQMGYALSG